jgi:hypothetical protein
MSVSAIVDFPASKFLKTRLNAARFNAPGEAAFRTADLADGRDAGSQLRVSMGEGAAIPYSDAPSSRDI